MCEVTTLCRHIQAFHEVNICLYSSNINASAYRLQGAYKKWTDKNKFKSKLLNAVKARKEAKVAQDREKQQSINPHFPKAAPSERILPYTDELFRDAAIQWLIETHQVRQIILSTLALTHASFWQPIQAFEHPAFKDMIDTAAQATRGVKIPNRKATRAYIIKLFKQNLTKLRDRLKVHTLLFDHDCNLSPIDGQDWTCILNMQHVASK